MSVYTSSEFNQHISRAQREALNAPVFVTTRGEPSHVLLSHKAYHQLTSEAPKTLAGWFMRADAEAAAAELEIAPRTVSARETGF